MLKETATASKKRKNIFYELIINPLKKNLACVFFCGGVFVIIIGSVFGDFIDSLSFVPLGTGQVLLKGGGAVLGAGVFAIIMESAQFIDIFQKHIFDVFYKPETVIPGLNLKDKWKNITNSLLRDVLPKIHLEASENIGKQFFEKELDYHFEEYYNSYNISINRETNIADIELHSKSTIILSPNTQNSTLEQSISIDTNGEITLKALRMNDTEVSLDQFFKKDDENDNKSTLQIPLTKYAGNRSDGVKAAKLEKIIHWTQDLSIEPYISVNISRYIKSATIKAKISKGFKVFFYKFGLGKLPEDLHHADDGQGFESWGLVKSDDLLLPGQGYILVMCQECKGGSK